MKEIAFDIKEWLGVISRAQNGWALELTKVSWNGGPAKFDVRDWSPDYTHMSRGMTFTDAELNSFVRRYRLWRKTSGIDDVKNKTLFRFDMPVPYTICEKIGVITPKNEYGSILEANIVIWNEAPPVVDIRFWSSDHTHMSKGLKLTQAQADKLCALYEQYQATA